MYTVGEGGASLCFACGIDDHSVDQILSHEYPTFGLVGSLCVCDVPFLNCQPRSLSFLGLMGLSATPSGFFLCLL